MTGRLQMKLRVVSPDLLYVLNLASYAEILPGYLGIMRLPSTIDAG